METQRQALGTGRELCEDGCPRAEDLREAAQQILQTACQHQEFQFDPKTPSASVSMTLGYSGQLGSNR